MVVGRHPNSIQDLETIYDINVFLRDAYPVVLAVAPIPTTIPYWNTLLEPLVLGSRNIYPAPLA